MTLEEAVKRIINGARIVYYYTTWEEAQSLLEVLKSWGIDPPESHQELVDFTLPDPILLEADTRVLDHNSTIEPGMIIERLRAPQSSKVQLYQGLEDELRKTSLLDNSSRPLAAEDEGMDAS